MTKSRRGFPARRAEHATINRLGDRYRRSRIDVAIADSVLEQHSGPGGSTTGNRNDGKGQLVRVAWPRNCNIYLGLYCPDLSVRRWRFPEAFGFFSGVMKSIASLPRPTEPQSPHRNGYVAAYLGYGTPFPALQIRPS
jgi:hypothetical protein